MASDLDEVPEAPKVLADENVPRLVARPFDRATGEEALSLPVEPLAPASVLIVAAEVPESSAFEDTTGVATGTLENP